MIIEEGLAEGMVQSPALTTCAWEDFANDPFGALDVVRDGIDDRGPGPSSIQHNPGVAGTMHEFKHGILHSGSKHGPIVKSRAQAIAIGMSEERKGK